MPNKISSLEVQTTRFDPLEAEVTITVVPEVPDDGLSLRGRLTGPRSPFAETVEIAYQLRPLPAEDGLLKARVVIPEANFWSPKLPFLYEGLLEICHEGQPIDKALFVHGLRHGVLNRKGLALNGRRLQLSGTLSRSLIEADGQRWRENGINLLVSPVTLQSAELWAMADRLGFFVLGELDGTDDELLWHAEEHLSRRVSAFGWLLPQSLAQQVQLWHNAMLHLQGGRRDVLFGVRLQELPLGVLPGHVSFILCDEQQLQELGVATIPRLILARRGDLPGGSKPEEAAPEIIGRVYRGV